MPKTLFAAQSLLHEGQRTITTERVINMFPEATPGGRLPVTLRSAPGLSQIGRFDAGRVWVMESTPVGVYAVVGSNLMLWNGVTFSAIGTVGDGPATMAWNGTQIAVVASGKYWIWDGTALSQITGGAFEDIGSVDYIDGYFTRSEEDGQRHDITGLLNGKTVDPTDFASAEHRPDKIRRVLSSGGLMWMMGESTVEPWQNVGAADFPFTRMQAIVLEKGLRSTWEATRLDNTIFWNSDESRAYRQNNFQPQKISTHAVDASLDRHTDAVSFGYQFEGHDFYVIRFSDRPAWIFDPATQSWHERRTGLGESAWEATASVHHNGKWYIGTGDGYFCELSGFQDRGQEMRREAISRNVTKGGERFVVNGVDIRCEVGFGGSVMTSHSSDSGRTFSPERIRPLGAVGAYDERLQINALGQHREFAFRIACTDNVDFTIYEAGVR